MITAQEAYQKSLANSGTYHARRRLRNIERYETLVKEAIQGGKTDIFVSCRLGSNKALVENGFMNMQDVVDMVQHFRALGYKAEVEVCRMSTGETVTRFSIDWDFSTI